jgi:hypothetical protein
MKKTLITVSLLLGAIGLQAQGYVNWNANGTWGISFYSPDTTTPTQIFTGDSQQDIPAGSTVYTGGWIGTSSSPGAGVGVAPASFQGVNYQNAAGFEVGLYMDTSAAAVKTDILTGTPLATDTINGGGLAGIGSEASDPSASGGSIVNLGLAAWYTDGGLYTSYQAAVAAGQPAGYAISTGTQTLGSLTGTPETINGATIGLPSFSLATTIPEPSTIALGVIGASTFLMRLRRKQ